MDMINLTSDVDPQLVAERLQAIRIEVGMKFQFKKDMYDKLFFTYTRGRNQKLRDQVLRRFINWEKIPGTYQIVITEVYDEVRPGPKRGRPIKNEFQRYIAENKEDAINGYNGIVAYGICQLLLQHFGERRFKYDYPFRVGTFKQNVSFGLGLLPQDFYGLTKGKTLRNTIIRSILPDDWIITEQEILLIVSCAEQVAKTYCQAGIQKLVKEGIVESSVVKVMMNSFGEWIKVTGLTDQKDSRIRQQAIAEGAWDREDSLQYSIPITLNSAENFSNYMRKEQKLRTKEEINTVYFATELLIHPEKLLNFVETFNPDKVKIKQHLQKRYCLSLFKSLNAAKERRELKVFRQKDFVGNIPQTIITDKFVESVKAVCDYWHSTGFAGKSSPGREKSIHRIFFKT